jgi:hypothetical protein
MDLFLIFSLPEKMILISIFLKWVIKLLNLLNILLKILFGSVDIVVEVWVLVKLLLDPIMMLDKLMETNYLMLLLVHLNLVNQLLDSKSQKNHIFNILKKLSKLMLILDLPPLNCYQLFIMMNLDKITKPLLHRLKNYQVPDISIP